MSEKKGFSLASVLGDVSNLNTGDEIIRIPIERIDPDPANFYSLEGIEDLAGNIELIGLQQPLRVRPVADRYTVVSGHRRRAAILLIRDGGSDQFADGVPCIVEYGDASPAMRELRLIYANASSRQMSAADLSKQAERVTELLYQLKEQGVEFPGRMREHVAQACKVSTSKLARLHAIRSNLDKDLLPWFDRGDMSEDAAYQLSRLPADVQAKAAEHIEEDKKHRIPTGAVVRMVIENEAAFKTERSCRAHAGGPQCHHLADLQIKDLFQQYAWNVCTAQKCCMDCYSKTNCSKICKEARDRVKLEKAVEAEKEEKRKATEKAEQEARKARIRKKAKKLLPFVDAAGLKDSELLYDHYSSATAGQVRKWAVGDFGDKHFYGEDALNPYFATGVVKMAKKLKISADEILDLKPMRSPSPATWQTGKPETAGLYAVRFKVSESAPGELQNFARWDGFQWKAVRSGKPIDDLVAFAWYPLPEV